MKLANIIRNGLSYALRSPVNPELLKTEQGKTELQSRINARFKPQNIFHELITHYEIFRKGTHPIRKISTTTKKWANAATNSNKHSKIALKRDHLPTISNFSSNN